MFVKHISQTFLNKLNKTTITDSNEIGAAENYQFPQLQFVQEDINYEKHWKVTKLNFIS